MGNPISQFLTRLTGRFRKQPRTISDEALRELEAALDYRFNDPAILVASLVHRSFHYDADDNPSGDSNERMEFLGDSVLSLVINESLYRRYPSRSEGELTKMKSVIVSKQVLAYLAKRIDLGDFVLVSDNAQRAGVSEMDSVLADTLEAVFGAVFLDGGFSAARRCILQIMPDDLSELITAEERINYKSLLQEYIQALHKVPPRYRVQSTTGPDHDKEFVVEVVCQGKVLGEGHGKTKKHAEQEAAKEAYKRIFPQ